MKSSKLTSNEVTILSVLENEKDNWMFGLEIVDYLEREGGVFFRGSLYNVLRRLEQKAYVEMKYGDPKENSDRGEYRRIYYRITEAGETALNEYKVSILRLWKIDISPG